MQFLQEDWAGGANQVARLRPPWKCGLIQMLLKQVLELDAGMLREPQKKSHGVFVGQSPHFFLDRGAAKMNGSDRLNGSPQLQDTGNVHRGGLTQMKISPVAHRSPPQWCLASRLPRIQSSKPPCFFSFHEI